MKRLISSLLLILAFVVSIPVATAQPFRVNGVTAYTSAPASTNSGPAGALWIDYYNGILYVKTNATDGAWVNVPASTSSARPGVFMFSSYFGETNVLATTTNLYTFRAPFGFTLTSVRASVNAVSSSGIPTFDIKENGATVFSTLLTIDANENSSTTAAVPAVISDASIADDSRIDISCTVAGTGATGAKFILYYTRP